MDERKCNDASAKNKEQNVNVEDWSKTTVTSGKEYENEKGKKMILSKETFKVEKFWSKI